MQEDGSEGVMPAIGYWEQRRRSARLQETPLLLPIPESQYGAVKIYLHSTINKDRRN
jgi:hypothetical protein